MTKIKKWETMLFNELYTDYLNTYCSELADYLDNYYFTEFHQAEQERKTEERELAQLDASIQQD